MWMFFVTISLWPSFPCVYFCVFYFRKWKRIYKKSYLITCMPLLTKVHLLGAPSLDLLRILSKCMLYVSF